MNSKAAVAVLLAAVLVGTGAFMAVSDDGASDGKTVCVTMPWQKEIVDGVSQNTLNVESMVGPTADPHASESSPSAILGSAHAMAYFYVGSGLEWEEKNIPTIKKELPNLRMVRTVDDRITLLEGGCGHDHGDADGHEHAKDPHVWTSPKNLKIMAENVKNALVECDPASAGTYEAGYAEYAGKLDALGDGIRKRMADLKGEILVWHGAWKYLLNDYAPAVSEFSLQHMPEFENASRPNLVFEIKRLNGEHGFSCLFHSATDSGIAGKDAAFREMGITLLTVDPLSRSISGEIERFVNLLVEYPPVHAAGHGG